MNDGCTVGELIDFLLEKDFSREDKIVIENLQGFHKSVKDIGRYYYQAYNRRVLIMSMKKWYTHQNALTKQRGLL